MTPIEPYPPTFCSDHWEDLRSRIKRTRWPDESGESDWGRGFELQFLKDLCQYWSEDFATQEIRWTITRMPD